MHISNEVGPPVRVAILNQTNEILNVSRKLSVIQPEPASDSRSCTLLGLVVLLYVKALRKKSRFKIWAEIQSSDYSCNS